MAVFLLGTLLTVFIFFVEQNVYAWINFGVLNHNEFYYIKSG